MTAQPKSACGDAREIYRCNLMHTIITFCFPSSSFCWYNPHAHREQPPAHSLAPSLRPLQPMRTASVA